MRYFRLFVVLMPLFFAGCYGGTSITADLGEGAVLVIDTADINYNKDQDASAEVRDNTGLKGQDSVFGDENI